MPAITQYREFDLRIGPQSEQGYPVEILRSPAGERGVTYVSFEEDWEFIEEVVRALRDGRASSEQVRGLGERLCRQLFRDEVERAYLRSIGLLASGEGLLLRLRVQAPELHAIPWEYIVDPEDHRRFLVPAPRVALMRYLEVPRPVGRLAVLPPFRVLVAASSPEGYPPLDVQNELKRIRDAMADLVVQGLAQFEFLSHATPSSLEAELDRGYHIFHFIGHGAFEDDRGVLLLEDERGKAISLDAETLGFFLLDTSVRLVFLNACETAFVPMRNPMLSLAHRLVEGFDIPAVIAMQYPISDRGACTLSDKFYHALISSPERPIGAHLCEARQAMMAQAPGQVEWGVPVLYVHTPDGVLFDRERWSIVENLLRQMREVEAEKEIHHALQVLLDRLAPLSRWMQGDGELSARDRQVLREIWRGCERAANEVLGVTARYIEGSVSQRCQSDFPLLIDGVAEALGGKDLLTLSDRVGELFSLCQEYLVQTDNRLRELIQRLKESVDVVVRDMGV